VRNIEFYKGGHVKVYLIYVRDEDFYQLLPPDLVDSRFDQNRVQVMAFPPIGIETLAPVIREHGHDVRMFDTCHPEMKEDNIVQALDEDKPDAIALSFLSTTSYPATQHMAERLKQDAPDTPIILLARGKNLFQTFSKILPIQLK
jgi:hypothetical protein